MSAGIAFTKIITGGLVSSGVGSIVTTAAKLALPAPGVRFELLRRIPIIVGAAALSGMVADHAVQYSNDRVDEYADMARGAKDGFKAGAEFLKESKMAKESDTISGETVDQDAEQK